METIKPIALPVLMAMFLVFLGGSLEAATFVVDRTDDDAAASACTDAENDCSLRGAISSANSAGGADVITLPARTYTISIGGTNEDDNAKGDLDIKGDLTINGDTVGATIIDGGKIDRVVHVVSGTVSINKVTVQNGSDNGSSGGGIYNQGTLTVAGCTIKNNYTSTRGGGISNSTVGSLTIQDSTISDNSSADGGGIGKFKGNIAVKNSTISGNKAGDSGGGIFSEDRGFTGTIITIQNTTLANNHADCDVIPVCGGNGNNAGDGGGIYIGTGSVVIKNSIIAGNTDKSPNNGTIHPDCSGWIDSHDYNLIQSMTGCTVNGTTTHNITGQDPRLGILVSNGGETITHVLEEGSPAINAGNPAVPGSGGDACEAKDQRGFSRGMDQCDIGAFEVGCGDGVVQAFAGEQCDDGNADDKDSCLNACVAASCGDGIVRTSVEACEDGNRVDNDSCTNACALPTCGDGIVQSGEECDDGGHNSSAEPDACRVACLNPSCGDDVIDTGEECDGGDSCDLSCRLEEHPEGPVSPDPLASPDSPDVADHEDEEEGNPATSGGCSLIRNASPPVGPAEIPGSL